MKFLIGALDYLLAAGAGFLIVCLILWRLQQIYDGRVQKSGLQGLFGKIGD